MGTWRYHSGRSGRRPRPRGPGPLSTSTIHRKPSCSRIVINSSREKNETGKIIYILKIITASNHTGLEGPGRVAFNRIVIFALVGRRYLYYYECVVYIIIIIMFIIDRDRRDDDVQGCGTRYTRRVSRGELDRRRTDGVGTAGAQRPLTVHGHNRRHCSNVIKEYYSISLILPNTFFVFVFFFYFWFCHRGPLASPPPSCTVVTDHLNKTFAWRY